MGYGPSAENRFGWCFRNEHGFGKRMTPYFATEADANHFHDFFTKNGRKYSCSTLAISFGLELRGDPDLRSYELPMVHAITKAFALKNKVQGPIVYFPKNETLREFYGCDMGQCVGYEVEEEENETEPEEEGENGIEEVEIKPEVVCGVEKVETKTQDAVGVEKVVKKMKEDSEKDE
jgi:hypothetical protein